MLESLRVRVTPNQSRRLSGVTWRSEEAVLLKREAGKGVHQESVTTPERVQRR